MNCNVLISSAGRRVALLRGFRQALSNLGVAGRVYAVDMSSCAAAFHDADEGAVVPRCTDPEFVSTMLELCQRWKVKVVVPTIDTELPVYAAHRERFAQVGTTVAISAPETIEIGSNKWSTYDWLLREGFPTVKQTTVAEARKDDWPFPLLVKPAWGSSSIGVAIVRTEGELLAATAGSDCVVQTLAEGIEYTVDVYVDVKGRCLEAVPRRRIEVRTGEVTKAMTVALAPVEELARRIAARLPGARGCLNVQIFHRESDGAMWVIEINPRFGGGYPLTLQSGADFCRWTIEEAMGTAPTPLGQPWRSNLVMLRFDDAVFVDAAKAGI